MKPSAWNLFRLRHILIFAACLALAASLFAILSGRGDPVFNGRRLSTSVTDLLDQNSQTYETSSNTIAQLGARAVPYVGSELKSTETHLERMSEKLNLPLPAHRTALGSQLAACRAVKILGTNAMSLRDELLPLAQSRSGSVRHAAFEALFVTSTFSDIWPLVTNAISSDRFIYCRLAATRYALSEGADPEAILTLLIENLSQGTKFKGENARRFAEELKTLPVPKEVLAGVLARFSHSSDPEVRRFVANALPICLPSHVASLAILQRLALDTNSAISRAATNALRDLRQGSDNGSSSRPIGAL